MLTVHQPLPTTLTTTAVRDVVADLLAVPIFQQDELADLAGLDAATGGELGRARSRGEFLGKPFDLFVTPLVADGWKATRLALVGAGPASEWTGARARRVATVAALAARQRHLGRLAFLQRSSGRAEGAAPIVQAIAEGLGLANYDGASYKTDDSERFWLDAAVIVAPGGDRALETVVERGRVLGEYTNVARAMSNEPGNALTPTIFAERAAAIGREAGLTVEILDEKRIAKLEMGLLLGVARGSLEPPRVIVLRHDGAPAGGPVLGLVGKGITFDTGGISIKPAENMDKMKDDMSGGAAVIAAMSALARLRAPIRVIGVVPTTENMPGGRALKPGDVIRGASGKTVEVLNTDAEGRLVLGDGLWYARQQGVTHLVDIATLTGAIVVALGKTTSGVFGTPDWWLEQVRQAGDRAGDRCWPMPIFEDYLENFKSEIADIANIGGRGGGAVNAALFVKQFAGDLPWAHMDIAGTAWAEEAKPYQPKGATGAGVRTLAELALAVDGWRNLR